MFTLDTLPRSGYVRIYATADRITPESASDGMAAESGWVEGVGYGTIQESRNYVSPVFEAPIIDGRMGEVAYPDEVDGFDTDSRAEIADIVSALGAFQSDDGSTLYAVDGVTLDYATDSHYMYALHAHVKHLDAVRGYIETDLQIAGE